MFAEKQDFIVPPFQRIYKFLDPNDATTTTNYFFKKLQCCNITLVTISEMTSL